MTIEVREFQPNDRRAVEEMILQAENFGIPFLDDENLKIKVYTTFPQFGRVLVAFDSKSDEIVGYSTIRFDWRALVITSVITHHSHLRCGIGTKMIERIKEIGKEHPLTDVIRVDTGDFMDYAHQFYLSCGFERMAHVPHYLSWNNHQVVFAYPIQKREE
jgi:ribosomal protein S18 acetylase RimI-like enzyme